MIQKIFLQINNVADTVANAAAQEGELTLSAWELALKGGWVMIILLFLSFIAVFIFFDRYFLIKKASKENLNFMNKIKDYIHDDKIDSAITLCQSANTPTARMIEKGINRIGRPLNDINAAIETVGKLEVSKLEKGLPILASIAGGAPMIGFLGTVLGMIRAFYDMSNAGNNIDVNLLSTGIYTALVTTAAGLIIGIIGYFAYNFLVSKVEQVVFNLEGNTTEFMDLLNEPVT